MALRRKHIDDMTQDGSVRSEAAAVAAEAAEAAAIYRAKAQDSKQELKKSWLTFLKTGVFVVALVVVFLATLAWFVNSQNVVTKETAVKASDKSLGVLDRDIIYYQRTVGETTHSKSYTIQKTGSESALDDLDMVPLDMLSEDKSNNSYTPVVIRIPVEGDYVTSLKPITVTLSCDGGGWTTSDGTKVAALFSNITQVQAAMVPNGAVEGETDQDIWNRGVDYMSTNGIAAKSFVTLNEANPIASTKSATVSFTLNYTTSDLTDGTGYIYVVIDYNEALAEQYIALNQIGGGNIGTSGSLITFVKDFNRIDVVGPDTES